jgi:hypothetical protein
MQMGFATELDETADSAVLVRFPTIEVENDYPFKNSSSRAFTRSGSSCWSQWLVSR